MMVSFFKDSIDVIIAVTKPPSQCQSMQRPCNQTVLQAWKLDAASQ